MLGILNTINYTKLFYWLTVADNAKMMFKTFMIIFTIISVISAAVWIMCVIYTCYNVAEIGRKWLFWAAPFMIIFWSLFIFTPSKKDALFIVAGGGAINYFTTDSTAKQIPAEFSNFVLTQIKSMSQDVNVDMDLRTTKEKILESAKKMTAEELLERIKVDPDFAKIILDE
jgi:hypothetical protein